MGLSGKSFAFKCHRVTHSNEPSDRDEIYAVNAIDFHPAHGTFVTAWSDGTVVFWDKENKQRLKQFERHPSPVVAAKFNPTDGRILAFATSYDWSMGFEGSKIGHPVSLFL